MDEQKLARAGRAMDPAGGGKPGGSYSFGLHNYDHTFPLRSKAPKGTKHGSSNAASRILLE